MVLLRFENAGLEEGASIHDLAEDVYENCSSSESFWQVQKSFAASLADSNRPCNVVLIYFGSGGHG